MTKKEIKKTQPVRLYSRGIVLGYKRSQRNQYESDPLIKIEGVNTREDAQYYLGKRIAYITKAGKRLKSAHKYKIVWGKIRKPHGNSGVVRARFTRNIPPSSFGHRVRIFMYPCSQ